MTPIPQAAIEAAARAIFERLVRNGASYGYAGRPEVAEAAILAALPHLGEPVGITGFLPGSKGFTMAAFEAEKVPVGTPLYLAPLPSVPGGGGSWCRSSRPKR